MVAPTFHPTSKDLINRFCESPAHAVLVYGSVGTGTRHAAQYIISKLGVASTDVIVVEKDKTSITIDAIRALYRLTKSTREKRLVILIDDADLMGDDAQHALLKLLEEPPSQVMFILTTHAPDQLFRTIRSRVAHIELRKISKEDTNSFISQFNIDTSKQQRIIFLANGRPAEIYRLATNDDYYDKEIATVTAAKRFLEASRYERLVLAKPMMGDRSAATSFLSMLNLLIMHMLYRSQTPETLNNADTIAETVESLQQNGNPRAQLLLLCQRLT